MKPITREQAEDMSHAHAEGWHAELAREGCPDCEDRPLRDYPVAKDLSTHNMKGKAIP